MVRSRRTTIVSVGIIVLLVVSACSFLTQGTDSTNNDTSDDNFDSSPLENTLAPSDLGSSDDVVDNFPLTPDPISVQVTLDEANMVKGESRLGSSIFIEGETADGTPFDLYLENKMYTVDADGRDYATNVLTFAYDEARPLAGDIVICPAVVAREARAAGRPLEAHYAHLLVHGTLHLQGYDHRRARDSAVMERRETAILRRLGYPDPYREPARAAA